MLADAKRFVEGPLSVCSQAGGAETFYNIHISGAGGAEMLGNPFISRAGGAGALKNIHILGAGGADTQKHTFSAPEAPEC